MEWVLIRKCVFSTLITRSRASCLKLAGSRRLFWLCPALSLSLMHESLLIWNTPPLILSGPVFHSWQSFFLFFGEDSSKRPLHSTAHKICMGQVQITSPPRTVRASSFHFYMIWDRRNSCLLGAGVKKMTTMMMMIIIIIKMMNDDDWRGKQLYLYALSPVGRAYAC